MCVHSVRQVNAIYIKTGFYLNSRKKSLNLWLCIVLNNYNSGFRLCNYYTMAGTLQIPLIKIIAK